MFSNSLHGIHYTPEYQRHADTNLYPPDTIMQQFWFGPIGDSSKVISNFTFKYSEWSPFFPFGYDLT